MFIRILPVLDLLGGRIVRGVAGRRSEYQPVRSLLAADARPESVAGAFVRQLALTEGYLADLDAIGGKEPDWNAYRRVLDQGLDLWVDAGLAEPKRAARLAEFEHRGKSLSGVVAGLETVASPRQLETILAEVGPARLVFSLDLKAGRPLTADHSWPAHSPPAIAQIALELGVHRLIVLDLARVGTAGGAGTDELCRKIRAAAPHAELTTGGGIHSLDQIRALEEAGCHAVLIASALHDGRIGRAEIEALRGKA